MCLEHCVCGVVAQSSGRVYSPLMEVVFFPFNMADFADGASWRQPLVPGAASRRFRSWSLIIPRLGTQLVDNPSHCCSLMRLRYQHLGHQTLQLVLEIQLLLGLVDLG